MPIRARPAPPKEAFLPARRLSKGWICLSNVSSYLIGNTNGPISLRAEFHKGFGLGIEAANVVVDDGLPDNPEGGFGSEKVFVVKLLDHFHDVLDGQSGVLDVGHLMPGFVGHGFIGYEAVFLHVLEELRPGEGMSHGNLNGLAIEPFGEL